MSAPIRSHGVWRPPPPILCGVRPPPAPVDRRGPRRRRGRPTSRTSMPHPRQAVRAERTRGIGRGCCRSRAMAPCFRSERVPARQPMSQGQCVAQRCALLRVMEGGLAERSSACLHLAREIESNEAMLTPACLRESPEGAGRERGRLGPLTASRRVTPSASAAERGCSRVSQRRCGVRGPDGP